MQTHEARGQGCVIALGANIGDAANTIKCAVNDLRAAESINIKLCSSIYQSEPMAIPKRFGDVGEQADYTNAVLFAEIVYEPSALLDYLQTLENKYGRVREQYWGARTLDLDIITYGEQSIHSSRLTIPHPDAYRRCFVLAPLLEILPDFIIPGYGKVSDLLLKCDTGQVTKTGSV